MLHISTHVAYIRKFACFQRHFRVTVIGASGGIGQPLSLMLKNNKLITELVLHDLQNVAGIAADLSHICTAVPVKSFQGAENLEKAVKGADVVVITAGVARRPGMDREQLFDVNAKIVMDSVKAIGKNSAHALIAIVTNPINAVVPMAAEVLRKLGVYDPKRLFGVTTLDCVRAQTFIGDILNLNPAKVDIPVIGGHSGTTIMPIMSQCNPPFTADDKCRAAIVHRIQMGGDEVVKAKGGQGSATLSTAYASSRFANALLLGLKGEKGPPESAYVESDVTCAPFFATPLTLGPKGIETNHGLPKLNECEQEDLKKAIKLLKTSIDKGIKYAK
ncbi:hypothetical protein KR222_001024 [Zaprionus bogoriensis]|nr:hypothetical protein KR222_001024 [Zaprionus bogoriensis]